MRHGSLLRMHSPAPCVRLLRAIASLAILTIGTETATAQADGPPSVRFNTHFEGASLGTIEAVGPDHYRCHVKGQQDEFGRNRQASWYYFRVDGARGRTLKLVMTDFVGEYNFKPGACPMGPSIVPVISHDGTNWESAASVQWDEQTKEATIEVAPERDSIWIAHQPPYTHSMLVKLLKEVDQFADARVEVIGRSVEGRDLELVTVTSEGIPDQDKKTVWLQARQHAWESGTSYVMEGALRFVTSNDPVAKDLRDKVVFKFTPMVDVDGVANGQIRFNGHGYDVNRHWNEVDLVHKSYLKLMPEIWYTKKAIISHVDSGRPIDLMVNLHNTESGEYLQTHANDDASRTRFTALSDQLLKQTTFLPHKGPIFATTSDSTANALYGEKRIPIALMELRIGKSPKTNLPPTIADRLTFGANLIRIMAECSLR